MKMQISSSYRNQGHPGVILLVTKEKEESLWKGTAFTCLLLTIREAFIRKIQKRPLVWSQDGLPEEGVVPKADSEPRCQEQQTG